MQHRDALLVWAQRLVDHITDHLDDERDALAAYQALTASTADRRISVLSEAILQDEARHHQELGALREELWDLIGGRRDPSRIDATRNGGTTPTGPLLEQVDALLALEHHDLAKLRDLAAELRSVADTRWQAVRIEAMQLDTQKHILLLEEIARLLRSPLA